MSVVEPPLDRRAGGLELGLWSLLVVLAGAVPGLGLAVGVVLALTRLRENRVARVLLPLLGAAATVLWALGILAPFGGAGVSGPMQP
jgi:hypothetical protein